MGGLHRAEPQAQGGGCAGSAGLRRRVRILRRPNHLNRLVLVIYVPNSVHDTCIPILSLSVISVITNDNSKNNKKNK